MHTLILSFVLLTSHPQLASFSQVQLNPSHVAVASGLPSYRHKTRTVVKEDKGIFGNVTRIETIDTQVWTWQAGAKVYQKQVETVTTRNYKSGVYQNTVTATSTRVTYKIPGQPRVHVSKSRTKASSPSKLPKAGHKGFSNTHHYNPTSSQFKNYQGAGFWRL